PVGQPRYSKFTEDEQRTHVTLWSIFRSPLMMGGNLPENTEFTKMVLTNEEIIAVNQQGYDAKQASRKDEIIIWTSKVPNSDDLNVAVFNIGKEAKDVAVNFAELGVNPKLKIKVRDLWAKADLGEFKATFSQKINSHGSAMFRISLPKKK
nr:hypothetical protein [Pseudarcicella sp.]